MENKAYDIVGNIMAYEAGELDDDATIVLFSNLIKTGTINSLQGAYGRAAERLVQAGYLDRDGNIL